MQKQSKIVYRDRWIANVLLLAEQLLGSRWFTSIFGGYKKAFLTRLAKKLQEDSFAFSHNIAQERDLRPNLFRQKYFDRSLPIIFSGAAKNWPCCQKWDLDYFSSNYGKSDLLLVDSQGLTTHDKNDGFQFLSVNELVSSIRESKDQYLRFSPLLHEHPELAQDLDLAWLREMAGSKTFANTYYMFMGGDGHKTLLHADQPCNLYVQVYGEKKWTMFLPEDSVCLYPQVTNTAYVKSPINLKQPDYEKYPLLKHARLFEAHLKPGDVMYIPPHVWHQVENIGPTIAVGYRFSSLKAALRSSVTFSLLRLLSTNPPIWKTREYGKVDTNLIWAHAAGRIQEVLKLRELRRKGNRS